MHTIARRISLLLLVGVAFWVSASYNRHQPAYWVVEIAELGHEKLEQIKHDVGVEWWIEAGDQLLILGEISTANASSISKTKLNIRPKVSRLRRVKRAHERDLSFLGADVLIAAGRSAIVQLRSDDHEPPHEEQGHSHAVVVAFRKNVVIARNSENESLEASEAVRFDNGVNQVIAKLDEARWFRDVETLAAWNRSSYGSQVLQARDWFVQQFSMLPGAEVSLQEFRVGTTPAYNVIAKFTGTERPDDWYVVGGHYDSTSEMHTVKAPGAEDNASGSAGVLEMARAFAQHRPKATVYFIAYSGEEQGLIGSRAHVASLVAQNQRTKVKAAIIMDMIGYTRSRDTLKVLLETEVVATSLQQTLKAAATQFTRLGVVTSFDAWGSDHVPYLNQSIPAVLTIDNDWSQYADYHRSTDLPHRIHKPIATEILKMNTATLAQLAGVVE